MISGHGNSGLLIRGSGGDVVHGNFIGTDITGSLHRGNQILDTGTSGFGAIGITVQVPNVEIGGENPGEGDLISGNDGIGLWLFGEHTRGLQVMGNRIGTDVSGSFSIANAIGIDLFGGATDNTIGGASAGARNLISGKWTVHPLVCGKPFKTPLTTPSFLVRATIPMRSVPSQRTARETWKRNL